MDNLIEQIHIMLKIGKFGSTTLIIVGNVMLVTYLLTKATDHHPSTWLIEPAIRMLCGGTAFITLFIILEKLAQKIGIA